MPTPNKQNYLILNHFSPLGPASFRKLIQYFGSLELFWHAPFKDWLRAGLKESVARDFRSFSQNFPKSRLDKTLMLLKNENINLLSYEDDNYPQLLREIDSAPPLLYYQGDLKALDLPGLAIVGSRKNTPYAERVLNELVPELPIYNIVTISGLALGVDALAHDSSLKGQGLTIAVLGSGLDQKSFYPRANRPLRDRILKNGGLILSEFPPLSPPLRTNFPRRNRLIAALSRAVLVVEAAAKSGALITANYALDFNREVLAIPGSIFNPNSFGPNNFLKQGAKLISGLKDILEVFNIEAAPDKDHESITSDPTSLGENEKSIYKIFKDLSLDGRTEIRAEEIYSLSSLDTTEINSTLSIMEIKGIIKNNFGVYSLLK